MSQRTFKACIGESIETLTCGSSGKELFITKAICENQGWGSCNRCITSVSCSGTNVLDEVKDLCQGQRACASLTDANDPNNICKEDNYLTVTYNCIHPATTQPSTSSSVNEASLPTRSVFNINSHETTSVLKTTYAETASVSIKRSEYKPTEAFQGRLSSSLDTATTVAIAISGAVVLLLILLLILVCLKRRQRKRASSDSRGIVEEVPNELYEMGGQFVAHEANQIEEKQNELYHMDGGYASADEAQIPGNSGQGEVVYTAAEDNPTAAYAVVTKPVTNV